jgi:hypothetical protein
VSSLLPRRLHSHPKPQQYPQPRRCLDKNNLLRRNYESRFSGQRSWSWGRRHHPQTDLGKSRLEIKPTAILIQKKAPLLPPQSIRASKLIRLFESLTSNYSLQITSMRTKSFVRWQC